jgi:Tol biopolymer transport system component
VWVVDANGLHARPLTFWHECGGDEPLGWSSDGGRLVFLRSDCVHGLSEVMSVGAGGGVPKLLHRFGEPIHAVAWSSRRIAYTDVYGTLRTMTTNARNVRVVARRVGPFAWSSSGQLAYVDGTSTAASSHTAVIHITGRRAVIRVPVGQMTSITWSPNGAALAITARPARAAPFELFSVTTDGHHLRRLTKNYNATSADWH